MDGLKRGVWWVSVALLGVPMGGGGQGPGDVCPLPVPVPDAPSPSPGGVPAPAWDLRCIELFPAALGGDARGVIQIRRPPSPFSVSVDPEGVHLHDLEARVEGLPDPASLGPYTTYMAWVTPLTLDPVLPLGSVTNGPTTLGTVGFARYMILISAEASAEVTERNGPLVLRGRSPSSRMEAHDLLSTAPTAEEGRGMGGMGGMGGDSAAAAGAGHDHHGGGVQADGWAMAPGYPGVPMLPGIMELRPRVDPLRLEAPAGVDPPRARPGEVVSLPDGGTLDLTADLVRQTIAGRELVMLAFNEQLPGPLIRVAANTTIFVNFTNNTPFHTAVHWHGIRLENRFDGVPGITQDPVLPGETFQYRIHFPDAGIYWYHPHHREDVQQELGLSGNLLVDPPEPGAFGPANQEQVLMLDDILLDEEGVVPFGAGAANYAMMGRFGNTMLVNGTPSWSMRARPGEVVRFHLTNAANTRTFNLSFRRADEGAGAATESNLAPGPDGAGPPLGHADHGAGSTGAPHPGAVGSGGAGTGSPLRMKVVASDVGRFEREAWVESVVLAPAERYVIDVHFPDEGTYVLGNHVMGINHRQGAFRSEVSAMGTVQVEGAPAHPDHGEAFGVLRTHPDVSAEIDRFRPHFDRPVDHELVLGVRETGVPHVIHEAMLYDWVFFNPVEWAGTMPMMNWVVSADDVTWTLREPSTGRENEAISWRFQVGDVVKIRIHNDRGAFHAMQHPIHIHGQRFLVLEQDGVPTQNLVWKDTVLLPVGSTTDILLELSNPGRWMVHCHISEHLEAEMKFIFDVEAREP